MWVVLVFPPSPSALIKNAHIGSSLALPSLGFLMDSLGLWLLLQDVPGWTHDTAFVFLLAPSVNVFLHSICLKYF